jgi:hypothetical protein
MPTDVTPTSELQEAAAPDPRQRTIQLIEQLLSTGRSVAEVLEEAERLAKNASQATVIAEGEPLATAPVMAQQPGFPHWRGHVWLVGVACLATLFAAAGAALLHLPTAADANPPAPSLASEPLVKPIARGGEPDNAKQMTAEQVSVLIARGDTLVSMADIGSARLFYERAAAAGDAQAALRLGTTYDPSFLRGVGLRGVPGDEAVAAYWYGRARDLGAPSKPAGN